MSKRTARQKVFGDADPEVQQALVEADKKLRRALLEADEKLRQAKGPAEEKLQKAVLEADKKLHWALLEANAKIQHAKGPAAEKLRQALLEANAKIQHAKGPAAEKLRQALLDANAKIQHAKGPAAEKLRQALLDAKLTLRKAEIDATAKLQQAERELAYQRDVFDRFFALSLDMMCIASSAGNFMRVSPSFDALGYSAEELLSKPILDFVHPDDKSRTLAQQAKLPGTPTIHFENRFRCKDGTYRWLSWVSGPDSAGTMYAMARDVTETRRTQEELGRAKDAAEVMNRELESFSYSVAHDLHAPLRSIDGFSQALLEDYDDKLDSEGKKYLSFIRESAQHMAHLIDDLLGLSRVTRSPLHREHVDMSALAHAANTRIQRAHPARHVEVAIEERLKDEGDPRLLAVVLDNLFGNAWKFTSKRADGRIEFGATSETGCPVYFVRDNGAGFDMAFESKLFGVFQRLHTAAEFDGTGVGLATVQRVISRHGGRVWATGEVNRGATLCFTLKGGSASHEAR
jgi:PAS domain S-box-containing protein